MTADKPRHLHLRQPDGALRETTINGNCSEAIVALQAEKVNHNPAGRPTERGVAPNPPAMGNQQARSTGHPGPSFQHQSCRATGKYILGTSRKPRSPSPIVQCSISSETECRVTVDSTGSKASAAQSQILPKPV